jgi:protein gp37
MKLPVLIRPGAGDLSAVMRLLAREGTGISWADLTFNGWIGCQKTGSPACEHCYAEVLATQRLGVEWGPHGARRLTSDGNWAKPPRWNRIAAEAGIQLAVFSLSLGDVLDNKAPPGARLRLAELIRQTPNLVWMLLTKRIGNARRMLAEMFPDGVPENVALGVTIVNQLEAERDLPVAVRVKRDLGIARLFISAEPLMGPLNLRAWLMDVDLLIVGGESGAGARTMPTAWADDLLAQATHRGRPFHFKQRSQLDYPKTYNRPETFPARLQRREHFA